MHLTISLLVAAGIAFGAPHINPRQANACFVIGNEVLPESVVDSVEAIRGAVTCNTGVQTLSGVPDVTSGGVTFSDVNFANSNLTPLEFALTEFAAATPLADTDLQKFEDTLNVYLATEAGIRSVGGPLTIKVPKFFLEFQVSRIQTAQGNPPTAAGLQVDHLLDKVLKNAGREDQALLDQVRNLATQLS
ncbi:hypothetical protein SAPIO_CDS4076 [Scedosporium apiospermum]|uniref:DUF7143 domain-containing protein n=1 Tax=Pseudallescheria apiosperma TaxID=563466 RepID=A0A084G988_PSEDA|nr:uncharacterized protein SAPIO_CDS4076 [Scedosporium apiospermum]KEZ43900.1 hypothetical protein SAPIO_CDS4076 [Scedosporium apiospermum]